MAGNSRPQNLVVDIRYRYLPLKFLGKPQPGSKAFFEDEEVKKKMETSQKNSCNNTDEVD